MSLVLDNARKQAVVTVKCLCSALNLFILFKQKQMYAFSG